MRWLVVWAALAGVIAGLLLPREGSATHIRYIMRMAPPAHYLNQHARLNCGWHEVCPTVGTALARDWATGDTAVRQVWFRGWGYRSGAPLENDRLQGNARAITGGEQACDLLDVKVWENAYPNAVRFDMQYNHTTLTVGGNFPIITSGSGVGALNNYHFGDYLLADLGCQGSGNHVHETQLPPGPPVIASRNTGLYPTGGCPGDLCGWYFNATVSYSTRSFDWQSH